MNRKILKTFWKYDLENSLIDIINLLEKVRTDNPDYTDLRIECETGWYEEVWYNITGVKKKNENT